MVSALSKDVLKTRAKLWRTARLRDTVVRYRDQVVVEDDGPEVPSFVTDAVAEGPASKRRKVGVRMSHGHTRSRKSKRTEREPGEEYVGKEYCASYFGDNTEAWITERYLKPLTPERLTELKYCLSDEGQPKIQFEGEMKKDFIRAVTEALYLVLRGGCRSPHGLISDSM